MSTQIATLRQTAAAAPAPRTIFDLLNSPKIERGLGAVAGKYFTADRFLRLAVNAVKKAPKLLECDPQTVLGCFMTSAALALEPNTIQQQAFLIPYKRRANVRGKWVDVYDAQFQIGSRGFVTLAHRSPYIRSIEAEAIHEGDFFEHMKGSESFLRYRKAMKDRGGLVGAWCLTKLESGIEVATVLPLDEIHKIRGKSETYNALRAQVNNAENDKDRSKAEGKLAETPWVMWEDDMATKSAIKKHSKQMPLAPEDTLSAAAEIDSRVDSRTIDMAAMADPDVARGVILDGYEPPALEDNESETASFGFPAPDREVEPVARNNERQDAPATAAAAAPQDDSEGPTVQSVSAAMHAAKTLDVLDMAADSGSDLTEPAERKQLDDLYRQRRAALEGKAGPQESPMPARRRPPINAE